MENLSEIKKKLSESLNSQIALIISSVLIAIVLWFIISITKYDTTSATITGIPLSIETGMTISDTSDLTLISCDVQKVDVRISGSRTEIGNLQNNNLTAKLVTDNITSAGTRTVSIKVESKNGTEFEIKTMNPSKATITLDKIETREFPVSPEIPNITFAENKTIDPDDFSCEPASIKITGPSEQLNKIADCKALSTKEAVLDSSYTLQSDEIRLYTEEGAVIESKDLTLGKNSITIYIPVLTQKTVDLSVSILNAPSNFDKDFLKFSMSANNIVLASSNSSTEFANPFEIGKILLSDIDIGYSTVLPVDTKDYINQSNLETVAIKLENDNLAKKDLIINDISISNPQPNYDYEIISKRINITVIGPEDVIEDLTANDIVADVNLLNETSNSNSFSHSVTISCPRYNNVWQYGTCKVAVNKTEKQTTTSYNSSSSVQTTTTTKTND
ncbi:MAG: hypothetical protein K2G63_05790 [Oscillospiraceae bacterium]|nr:hypothetical protein [Oscillospiraceae bacterium]